MVGKGTRGGICHTIHQYSKANNKYMKAYDKNKDSLYLMYWDANNFYKKTLWPLFLWMGFNCLKATATSNRQFDFSFQFPEIPDTNKLCLKNYLYGKKTCLSLIRIS